MRTKPFALPFPLSINVLVFKDDGNWEQYAKWWMRPHWQTKELCVARITLGHYEGSDEPDYDCDGWRRKSEQLVKTYPGCIFVYASNG